MDGSRFDRITRRLGEPRSRRQAVGTLGALLGASGLAATQFSDRASAGDVTAQVRCLNRRSDCAFDEDCCSHCCMGLVGGARRCKRRKKCFGDD